MKRKRTLVFVVTNILVIAGYFIYQTDPAYFKDAMNEARDYITELLSNRNMTIDDEVPNTQVVYIVDPDIYIADNCLASKEACIDRITKRHGIKPALLSYEQVQPDYILHPVSSKGLVVPNIVHYIHYGVNFTLDFLTFVSFKSVDEYIKPSLILVWGDLPPNTTWWRRVQQEVPNVYYVQADRVSQIGGLKPGFIEHETDYMRLKIIHGEILANFLKIIQVVKVINQIIKCYGFSVYLRSSCSDYTSLWLL